MTEFKQIVGRGTRVRERDLGSAKHQRDKEAGPPARVTVVCRRIDGSAGRHVEACAKIPARHPSGAPWPDARCVTSRFAGHHAGANAPV